jgi:hypothetical protein
LRGVLPWNVLTDGDVVVEEVVLIFRVIDRSHKTKTGGNLG